MNKLVELIRSKVVVKSKPAIYTSGGLDSTIILHHLREKTDGEIYTYTAKFNNEGDEHKKARRLADYYNTIHKNIDVDNYVKTLPEIMKFFRQPRYNVWPYWLAKQAQLDDRKTVYIGEGSDEHFGGYSHRDYLEAWAMQLMYVRYTYDTIHTHLDLNLQVPFSDMYWKDVVDYYSPPDKKLLRDAYSDILPDFVIDTNSSQPPAFVSNYRKLWNTELYKYFPDYSPSSVSDIREILQLLVTKIWIQHREYLMDVKGLGIPDAD